MRLGLASLLLSLSLVAPASVRAEDWLALHPECGFGPEARALGRMALIYPRPGLPAVVRAGERLVLRVRVPSGLTPPPGIQKDRALRGWSAELVGQSVALGGGAHGYETRVVDVRPDGQSTLVYRASIEVPRWAAPGTYGLRVSAPGGSDALGGAVRIVAPDAALRLVRLPPELLAPRDETDVGDAEADAEAEARRALSALATAPYDVVVTRGESLRAILESARPSASLPAVLVVDESAPIVLRGDDDALLVFGECDDRYAPFAMQLEGLARREARTPRPFVALEAELGAATEAMLVGPSVVAEAASLTLEAGASPVELTLRYPDDGRALRIEPAVAVAFYPAVTIPMTGQVRSIAARLTLAAGETAHATRAPASAPTVPRLTLEPAAPRSGDEIHLHLDDAGLALVAWRLEEDITLVGPDVRHTYRPVGEERVHLFVITEEGVGQPRVETLTIATREVRGCSCGAAGAGGRGPGWADLWLIGLVLLRMGIRGRNRRSPRLC